MPVILVKWIMASVVSACCGCGGGAEEPADLGLVGFQNSVTGPDLGLLCDSLVLVDEAAEDLSALDPLLGEVGDGVVGPGRAELAAAMGSSSVVMNLVRGQRGPQMPRAEDQHPVGDLGPGGEHEPFGVSVGPHPQRRLTQMIGTDVCG